MCVSTPKPGATQAPAQVSTSAENLQLGSAALGNRSAGIFGRLALTGGRRAARSVANTAGQPSGTTTSNQPGGTLGLPSDFAGNPVYGGIVSSGELGS